MKKTVKKIFKVLGIVLGIILLALIAYIIYLYASYHRIEDNLVLEVEPAPDAGEVPPDPLLPLTPERIWRD